MKKRLFISSILMTLVLLVAITTATFAWYKASAGGSLSVGTAEANILTAESADQYTLGNDVTLNASFGSVSGNAYRFQKADLSYVAMPTYVPAGDPTPTTATFQDVELTDENGHTWAFNGSVDKDVTSQAVLKYGVAKVHLELSGTLTAENLQAIANGTAQTLTITISAAGKARVHKDAPTVSEDGFEGGSIILKLTVNVNGTYQLNYWTGTELGTLVTELVDSEHENAPLGQWDVEFYYSVAGSASNNTGSGATANESASHTNDKLSITIE